MRPDMLKRYLILLAVLVVCAGAAWYFTNASAKPAEDAVLAYFQENMELPEKQGIVRTENMYCDGGAKPWQVKSSI